MEDQLNDNMYKYVSQRIFEYLKKKYDFFDKLDVLLLGLTFKEKTAMILEILSQ